MEKKKYWIVGISIAVTVIFLLASGFHRFAVYGCLLSVGGAIDFLFIQSSFEGHAASEAYGDAGEMLWEFRSFVLMVGGPFLGLYAVLHA